MNRSTPTIAETKELYLEKLFELSERLCHEVRNLRLLTEADGTVCMSEIERCVEKSVKGQRYNAEEVEAAECCVDLLTQGLSQTRDRRPKSGDVYERQL